MKKMMLSLLASGVLVSAAFAAAELTDANKEALTKALTEQGYTVEEIMLDDAGNYSVKAMKDGAEAMLVVDETFAIVGEGEAQTQ